MSAVETVIAGRDLLDFVTNEFTVPKSAGEVIDTAIDVAGAGYAAKTVFVAIVSAAHFCVEHYPVDGIRCTSRRMMSDFLLL